MYQQATVPAQHRTGDRNVPALPRVRRAAGLRALVLAALAICAVIGALWTYHDLRHPQDSFSPATPLLGIALLLLASRMRKRPR